MVNNELEIQLNKLGFSENESRVYLALLEEGFSPVGPIIKKTGLHRNIVYETLDKLVAKRLVSEAEQKKIKHFKVLDLNKIIKEKESQLDLAKNLVTTLAAIKKSENVEITVYEGEDGFQTALINAVNYIQDGHSNLVLGAGGENFYKAMGDAIKIYDRARLKKNVISRMIAYEYQRTEHQKSKTINRPLVEIKYLSDQLNNPSGTVVFDDKVLLQIYSAPPAVVEIKSREVSKSYRNYFGLLWKMAKK